MKLYYKKEQEKVDIVVLSEYHGNIKKDQLVNNHILISDDILNTYYDTFSTNTIDDNNWSFTIYIKKI